MGTITYKTGSIWYDQEAPLLVIDTNCVGALELNVTEQLPGYAEDYHRLCSEGLLSLQRGPLWHSSSDTGDRCMITFPVRHDWTDKASLDAIKMGLDYIKTSLGSFNQVAFPKLGCDHSSVGLDWVTEVKPLMEEFAQSLPDHVEVIVYVDVTDKYTKAELEQIDNYTDEEAFEALSFENQMAYRNCCEYRKPRILDRQRRWARMWLKRYDLEVDNDRNLKNCFPPKPDGKRFGSFAEDRWEMATPEQRAKIKQEWLEHEAKEAREQQEREDACLGHCDCLYVPSYSCCKCGKKYDDDDM